MVSVDTYGDIYADVYGGGTGMPVVTANGVPLDPALVLAPVKVGWGRDEPSSQPSPPTAQFVTEGTPPPIGAEVTVTWSGGVRFSGVVTAVTSDGWRFSVTCHGRSSLLGRAMVGAPPWPEQTLRQRFEAIIGTVPGWVMILGTGGADTSQWWSETVTATDVDRKAAMEIILDAASKTGCLVWEDKQGRVIVEPPDWRAIKQATVPPTVPASWCRTGAEWGVDVAQVINRVSVSYGGSDASQETVVEDAASEAAHGEHTISVSSMFATEQAAARLGSTIVGRWKDPAWVLGSVVVDSARAVGTEWQQTIAAAEVSSVVSLPILDTPELHPGTQRQLWVLEGADEELWAGRHVVTWRLSPAHRYGVRGLRWSDWAGSTWTAMAARTWLTAMEGAAP